MLLYSTISVGQYQYDPNDFATEVISYAHGTGIGADPFYGCVDYNDPNFALGNPTVITTGDKNIGENVNMPVVPVYGAFRWYEIVTIGQGGSLTLKFNHPVANDRNNPYGIDFIIFGNSNQVIAAGGAWTLDSNPEAVTVTGTIFYERGIVSVSKDGNKWYKFVTGTSSDPNIVYANKNGPYADDFAPTCGFDWDSVNHVWGAELDPTRPIDPNLTAAGMNGKTVVQMIAAYKGSAGGTGFDIGIFGLDWIQYVRIEDNPAYSSATTEIDAVSDVAACGDYKHPFPIGDLNNDCRVDMEDFAIAAQQWIDMMPIKKVADTWLECTWNCQ